ncbi:MAG TPA: hypothetical protein VGQ99_11070 [Tepidisphaeraceae bacterium]|jgi:hypothetical protein|nr:hypothetical protein [Tepidisphaeraceae bacterium]
MDRTLKKVRTILREAFPSAEIAIDRPESDSKIGGVVIWKGFSGKDELSRQLRLWKELRAKLSIDEQAQVTAILTFTPKEHLVMQEG